MTWGPDGNLYVGSTNLDSVFRYDGVDGSFIDVFVPAGIGGLDNTIGITFDDNGRFYAASGSTSEVLQYSAETEAIFTVTLSEAKGLPVTVDFDTVDGSAKSSSDYTMTSGTLSFAPGETSKTIFVPVIRRRGLRTHRDLHRGTFQCEQRCDR